MNRNYDVITFFRIPLFRVANFADIINIVTMFIETTFKDPINV